MEAKYKNENNVLLVKNMELTNQLDTVKKEQVYLRTMVDKLVIDLSRKHSECQEMAVSKPNPVGEQLVDDYRNIEATVKENQSRIAKHEVLIKHDSEA